LIDTPGNAVSVYVQNKYAYVADENNGVVVIDVSIPKSPEIVFDSYWVTTIFYATF